MPSFTIYCLAVATPRRAYALFRTFIRRRKGLSEGGIHTHTARERGERGLHSIPFKREREGEMEISCGSPHRLSLFLVLFYLMLTGSFLPTSGTKVGINYGQIANNLPTPSRVAILLQSIHINRVKLYDADPNVLRAFANSDVEFIVAIGNENVASMMDTTKAQAWLEQNIVPYLPQTRITCITVGNEVFSGNDTTLMSNLLPAMQSVYQALVDLGLDKQINLTTAHSLTILANSYPPSSGAFRADLGQHIQPLLNFHSMIKSPFLINAYPYFAYKDDPSGVSLEYVLFKRNPGTTDPATNLHYDNMLYAQIDSVYSAIKAMGHRDIDVRISETGWPSKGDADEAGATLENAGTYNRNLLKRIAMNEGTPMKPSVPIDIFVFALFNENMKPGPTSERNYGLFYPDGTPVYNIGLQGYYPTFLYSAASLEIKVVSSLIISMLTTAVVELIQFGL